MSLSNLKVGMRLGVAFALVLTLLMGSAALGLFNLGKSNTALETAVNDVARKTDLVNTMAESVHIVQRVARSMVLLSEGPAIERERVKITTARERYNKADADIEKMGLNEEGTRLLAAIRENVGPARASMNQVIDLGVAGKDAEATTLLLSTAGPAAEKWQNALDKMVEYQQSRAKQAADEAGKAYESSRFALLLMSCLGLVIGVGAAWLVTRSITGPLNNAVRLADAVGSGRLDNVIDETRRDEAGMLLSALARMQKGLKERSEREAAAGAEIDGIVQAASAGDFSGRLATEGKEGFFKTLSSGMNQLMETCEQGLNDVAGLLGAFSKGDLSHRIERDYQGLFGKVKESGNRTAEQLTRVLDEVRSAADALTSAANQVSATA